MVFASVVETSIVAEAEADVVVDDGGAVAVG